MKPYYGYGLILLLMLLCTSIAEGRRRKDRDETSTGGTKWAVLVAGSNGYQNYRHQADVCHAYQILKRGGLKDENIIVLMYDDIANNKENPTPGIIINKPNGPDVYAGVPKDYTKSHTNARNFYAVLLGNKSALTGGSGKVVRSGPNDQIFVYYSDHGSRGVLGMPVGENVYAKDFMAVLKKKHESGSYKSMVIYVEACEAGSMFKGLLPNNINIYVTTASNHEENSYGYYCPGDNAQAVATASSPDDYGTCLGDLYSISWLEDSDVHNMNKETLQQQYEAVKNRTTLSHVMQYGYLGIEREFISNYMGSNEESKRHQQAPAKPYPSLLSSPVTVSQRDATLLYLQDKIKKAAEGSAEKLQAQKRLQDEVSHREQVDRTMKLIEEALLGTNTGRTTGFNAATRSAAQPLVDDWDCFKGLVRKYEQSCGTLSSYGRKYMGAFANMCNSGVGEERLASVTNRVCAHQ